MFCFLYQMRLLIALFLLTHEISKSLSGPTPSLGDLLAHWFRSGVAGMMDCYFRFTFIIITFFLRVSIAVTVSLAQVIGDQTSYLPATEGPG